MSTENPIKHDPPLDFSEKKFDELSDMMIRRQEEREKLTGIPDHVTITIDTDKPIQLICFGDLHSGAEAVDYRRIKREINYVKNTPNCYALALGDLVDGFFWGGATQGEDIANFTEQELYIRGALNELRGKLLVAWSGQHDHKWPSKTGNSMYFNFQSEFGAHYMEGVGYVTLKVGEQDYKISAAHKHKGFSIYNSTQSAERLYREAAEGADIVITADRHKKSFHERTVKMFGGGARLLYLASLGTYKQTDSFARGEGYPRLAPEEMGASGFILDPSEKRVETIWKIGSRIRITDS